MDYGKLIKHKYKITFCMILSFIKDTKKGKCDDYFFILGEKNFLPEINYKTFH